MLTKKFEEISKKAIEAGIKVDELEPEMQIDGAGLRALADEMRIINRRHTSARNASVRHASETSAS